ncbi:MAG: bifunctional histidinol-phosphatase/imidazoleglycerol-phosphate dehydratase HisB [Tannerellaceae bacterium]|jgi:imidazoleglycerol-phosphate dehydratase/histidinol-phosphatase|nr:bifunctional histidinol-phosphatase/imidazoleglycerol-phosphate dehydratase HisB [Tannerellaceae bacterium]
MKKRALFIDRDGTIVEEVPVTEQLDDARRIVFCPKVIRSLYFLREHTDYELVMVTNQDGLGTESFPQERFEECQGIILRTLSGEGVRFDRILIDESFASAPSACRKPGVGMLGEYMSGEYDLANSYVIGDRRSDMELAVNLGCKGIWLREAEGTEIEGLPVVLVTQDWEAVAAVIYGGERRAIVHRQTRETDVYVEVNVDGRGAGEVKTGLGMLDHLLEQIPRHGGIDMEVRVKGDLHVDEHHTIEDTALALGEALRKALGDKRGTERYGYALPMDDCLAQVVVDFGGRPWLEWEVGFVREKVGDVPTEMFRHFFKSLSDAGLMNLYIEAKGTNEHHKIEAIFKGLARAIKMAVRRDIYRYDLPSTKGVL